MSSLELRAIEKTKIECAKKFFEEKSTNTVRVIDSDAIQRLPVRGVSSIVSLQSGVVVQDGDGGADGNAEINVRGGRGSEVLYIVDGIPQNNLYNRESVNQVSNNAIDQISFQVGGYEAKYGQAQSGIVNVTTKSGNPYYSLLVDVLTSTYTDDYDYNLYNGTLSGPIIPGIAEHTIFLSAERGWFGDANPPGVPLTFESIGKTYDAIPNNKADVWRFSGKTNSRFGSFTVVLSALWNKRTAKQLGNTRDIRLLKNSSDFLDEFYQENAQLSARLTQTVSSNTFWNFNFGYRTFEFERYNPFLRDADHTTNLLRYGDSTYWHNNLGIILVGDGQREPAKLDGFGIPVLNERGEPIGLEHDEFGVFRPRGYSVGLYQHRQDDQFTGDLDLTTQIDNHLLEIGIGASKHTVRGYGIFPVSLAGQQEGLSTQEKFMNLQPWSFGYDVSGAEATTSDFPAVDPLLENAGSHPTMSQFLRPREPVFAYAYIQDRFELEDFVLNLGLRVDYYDVQAWELRNPQLPYGDTNNPDNLDLNRFDIGDFKVKDVEFELSPRIGIGFPVTESTVFHAQYGRFIQAPELNDMYAGPFSYDRFITMEPQSGFNGGLIREETTQYEIGFRQLLGNTSAINVTLFYKNIKGLANRQNNLYQRVPEGEVLNAIYTVNADFGTNKGVAFSLDVTRLSYFSLSLQYTFATAEGTGSSTNSSQTAVFRNTDREAPKVIAPLDFDQKHTGVFIVDFYIPQGDAGIWEMLNASAIISFASGRPYTPVTTWDILGDNGLSAENTGYVNSANGPGTFRVDMKIEKSFAVGDFFIVPYLWVENLFNSVNVINVWRSTGDGYTTNHLNTDKGKATALNNFIETGSNGYVQDYQTLERDPRNFGIPRLIKLGLKLNFTRF